MKNMSNTSWTAAELAQRWAVHPASVLRIMKRFGVAGAKFGPARQAARRFSTDEVAFVESQAHLESKN